MLTSGLLLGLLFWQWRPLPEVIWTVANPAVRWSLHRAFWLGWAAVLVSTFLIDRFDLFGLRQVFSHGSGREYAPVALKTPGRYAYVRHPIMLGFLLAFWSSPTMTVGHLLFAAATTAYILIALRFEELDMVSFHGERYEAYKRRTGMLFPRLRKS